MRKPALSLVVALGTIASSGLVAAHELGGVQVRARFDRGNRYELQVSVDRSHLPPELRGAPKLRERLIGAMTSRIDGAPFASVNDWNATETEERLVLSARGRTPEHARAFDVAVELAVGSIYISCKGQDGDESVQWVAPGSRSAPCPLGVAAAKPSIPKISAVIREYAWLGLTHIVPGGADHILFVLGLCLLARGLRPLLAQVTAFTLAHSVALGLAAAKIVTLPSRWVEPLIALSIVCIAVENVFADRVAIRRTALVFAFGLLHGLGFAGVLSELGLPDGRFLTALLAFNCGVEAGQLLVIGAAFGVVGWWTARRSWYRSVVVVPASWLIAAVGVFWVIERILS